MLFTLHQLAAALYLAAGVGGGLSLAAPGGRARSVSVGLLAIGGLVHLGSFGFLHRTTPTPQLTDLPAAVSLMACMAVLSYLAFLRHARWSSLVVWIAPIGFLGAFIGGLRMPHAVGDELFGSGRWPHAHVLLASAGLALLAVAGIAGIVFLREARALKAKRRGIDRTGLPSLEALDRVNLVSLAVGFPLLTLGVVTGMFWLEGTMGRWWSGSPHEIWTTLAWVVYLALAVARFGVHQSARSAALSAVGGAAFLLFAVIGVGLVA